MKCCTGSGAIELADYFCVSIDWLGENNAENVHRIYQKQRD